MSWESLSSGGLLTGTPTTATMDLLTVQATDAIGEQAQRYFSVASGTPLSITTSSLPAATVGTAYVGPLASSGGSGSHLWDLESCMPNIDLCFTVVTNADGSGQVQGSPTQSGAYTLVVQVGDSIGATAQKSLTLTVSD